MEDLFGDEDSDDLGNEGEFSEEEEGGGGGGSNFNHIAASLQIGLDDDGVFDDPLEDFLEGHVATSPPPHLGDHEAVSTLFPDKKSGGFSSLEKEQKELEYDDEGIFDEKEEQLEVVMGMGENGNGHVEGLGSEPASTSNLFEKTKEAQESAPYGEEPKDENIFVHNPSSSPFSMLPLSKSHEQLLEELEKARQEIQKLHDEHEQELEKYIAEFDVALRDREETLKANWLRERQEIKAHYEEKMKEYDAKIVKLSQLGKDLDQGKVEGMDQLNLKQLEDDNQQKDAEIQGLAERIASLQNQLARKEEEAHQQVRRLEEIIGEKDARIKELQAKSHQAQMQAIVSSKKNEEAEEKRPRLSQAEEGEIRAQELLAAEEKMKAHLQIAEEKLKAQLEEKAKAQLHAAEEKLKAQFEEKMRAHLQATEEKMKAQVLATQDELIQKEIRKVKTRAKEKIKAFSERLRAEYAAEYAEKETRLVAGILSDRKQLSEIYQQHMKGVNTFRAKPVPLTDEDLPED